MMIPKMAGNEDLKTDVIGIVIAAIAIFLVIFPLIEGRGFGWPAWCFIMMAAALPFFWGFVACSGGRMHMACPNCCR